MPDKHKRVVAIGGGTGLANLLRVLKELTPELTAVVAVTDDGGSSGKLRKEFGILPPGDVRNCLVALSDAELAMDGLLSYRFPEEGTLSGHTVGNILLAALQQAEGLDFAGAVARLSNLLAITGRVLPATCDDVCLAAVLEDGSVMHGETAICADSRRVKKLFLQPENCRLQPEVLAAVAAADYVFIGPGSVYSSLITNLLVPGLAQALKQSPAKVCYLANMATGPAELDTAELSFVYDLLESYAGEGRLIDVIIANNGAYPETALAALAARKSRPIVCDTAKLEVAGVHILQADFVDEVNFWQHDRVKLKTALAGLLGE